MLTSENVGKAIIGFTRACVIGRGEKPEFFWTEEEVLDLFVRKIEQLIQERLDSDIINQRLSY